MIKNRQKGLCPLTSTLVCIAVTSLKHWCTLNEVLWCTQYYCHHFEIEFLPLISLSNDKILDRSNLKDFANNKINLTHKINFVKGREREGGTSTLKVLHGNTKSPTSCMYS